MNFYLICFISSYSALVFNQNAASLITQKSLKIFSDGIYQIDPDQLDTEDREQVVISYEKLLEINGLESFESI